MKQFHKDYPAVLPAMFGTARSLAQTIGRGYFILDVEEVKNTGIVQAPYVDVAQVWYAASRDPEWMAGILKWMHDYDPENQFLVEFKKPDKRLRVRVTPKLL